MTKQCLEMEFVQLWTLPLTRCALKAPCASAQSSEYRPGNFPINVYRNDDMSPLTCSALRYKSLFYLRNKKGKLNLNI